MKYLAPHKGIAIFIVIVIVISSLLFGCTKQKLEPMTNIWVSPCYIPGWLYNEAGEYLHVVYDDAYHTKDASPVTADSTMEILREGTWPYAVTATMAKYLIPDTEKLRFELTAVQAAIDCVKPGMMEVEVLAEAEYAMTKLGSQGSSFRMQVLTHSRQMHKHPYASRAILEDNAPVVIHLGASCEGYVAKMCRTVFLGKPDPESVRIYETLKAAQKVAVAALRPGVTCGEIYDKTTEYVATQGFEKYWVMNHIGYGVGIRQSEFYPIIAKDSQTVLEENMVVDLLLPSIYVPKVGGPRITDTILMKKEGVEYLTQYPTETVFKA